MNPSRRQSGEVILVPGREKSLLRHHPWLFSSAIKKVNGTLKSGDTVDVLSEDGRFLGRGAFSPGSQIRIRMWTFNRDEHIEAAFFQHRLERARLSRAGLEASGQTTAYRLINAESDGLPGLIVDRYNEFLVCQFLTAGSERWKNEIVDILGAWPGVSTIIERSDVDVRKKEGLELKKGFLFGNSTTSVTEIAEGGIRYQVDLMEGHKTGFYLDQRTNRFDLKNHAQGADLLNCFSYTGGFGLAALAGGAAHVTHIDTSATALEQASTNAGLNQFDSGRISTVHGDVFHILRNYRMEQRSFDIVVLDPPKFADSVGQIEGACRGYKDINLLAFQLIKPGGLLYTFSCSGRIEPELFQKVVADAALDAGREARVLRRLSQADDHPVSLAFPEGLYLKGLVCSVW